MGSAGGGKMRLGDQLSTPRRRLPHGWPFI